MIIILESIVFDFRWINSKKSVSGLEGFFLRLRLGKWAEGLGGTGYHVARIEGMLAKSLLILDRLIVGSNYIHIQVLMRDKAQRNIQ